MLSEESVGLFGNIYHDTSKGVACALHLTTCVFAFHDQCNPYGKSHGNISGYSFGFFQMDCGSLECPIARTFPPSSRCFAAIALSVSEFIVSYSSLVSVCTVKGHIPSVVPLSSSISWTLVASGILFVMDC